MGDGIARIYGLNNAQSGELVEVNATGVQAIVLNLEEDNVGVVLMGPSDGIKEGSRVHRTGRIASIQIGEGIIGRVVDTLGEPIVPPSVVISVNQRIEVQSKGVLPEN